MVHRMPEIVTSKVANKQFSTNGQCKSLTGGFLVPESKKVFAFFTFHKLYPESAG